MGLTGSIFFNTMDDEPRYRFEALRKDFDRLIRIIKSPEQVNGDGNIEQQKQQLTTNVESHFEKLGKVFLEGQKCTESRVIEHIDLIHQRSQENYEERIQDLKQDLKEEKTSRLRAEEELREMRLQQSQVEHTLKEELFKVRKEREEEHIEQEKELSKLNQEKEKQLKDLKEQFHYSEAKVKCLEEKCQSLEIQRRQLEKTLSSYDSSDDEIVREFIHRVEKPDTISLASVDTLDSAFSDSGLSVSSCAEILRELNQKVERLICLAEEAPKTATALLKLPTLIRGFCVNIQESVASPDGLRLNLFSRSLGVDPQCTQQRRDYGQDMASLFWSVIHEWYSSCDTDASRATVLNKIIQACHDCGVPNPLDVQPMPTQDRLIIESNYSYIVEHLMVYPALVYLRDCQFLSSSIVRYVTDPMTDPERERIMRFVDILPVCGQRALDHFLNALRNSEQSHIAERIMESNPERFAGFKAGHHKEHVVDMPDKCQNIERQKKKKMLKQIKEKLFKSKSKSYKLCKE